MTEPERFRELPKAVRPEDMITSQDVAPVPDPEAGRDTDQDFLIRYPEYTTYNSTPLQFTIH